MTDPSREACAREHSKIESKLHESERMARKRFARIERVLDRTVDIQNRTAEIQRQTVDAMIAAREEEAETRDWMQKEITQSRKHDEKVNWKLVCSILGIVTVLLGAKAAGAI